MSIQHEQKKEKSSSSIRINICNEDPEREKPRHLLITSLVHSLIKNSSTHFIFEMPIQGFVREKFLPRNFMDKEQITLAFRSTLAFTLFSQQEVLFRILSTMKLLELFWNKLSFKLSFAVNWLFEHIRINDFDVMPAGECKRKLFLALRRLTFWSLMIKVSKLSLGIYVLMGNSRDHYKCKRIMCWYLQPSTVQDGCAMFLVCPSWNVLLSSS